MATAKKKTPPKKPVTKKQTQSRTAANLLTPDEFELLIAGVKSKSAQFQKAAFSNTTFDREKYLEGVTPAKRSHIDRTFRALSSVGGVDKARAAKLIAAILDVPDEIMAPPEGSRCKASNYVPGAAIFFNHNPNSHDYSTGNMVLVISSDGTGGGRGLRKSGTNGNYFPSISDLGVFRVATPDEIDTYFRDFTLRNGGEVLRRILKSDGGFRTLLRGWIGRTV